MSEQQPQAVAKAAPSVSLDTWAVLTALLAAALIRFGLIPRVPW
ncbi:MAG: hypothetical protein WBL63_03995 [Candidatus Acidiferrum sp.]